MLIFKSSVEERFRAPKVINRGQGVGWPSLVMPHIWYSSELLHTVQSYTPAKPLPDTRVDLFHLHLDSPSCHKSLCYCVWILCSHIQHYKEITVCVKLMWAAASSNRAHGLAGCLPWSILSKGGGDPLLL